MGDERSRPGIDWRSGEVSWPLALLAGFGGTWLGISLSVPGLSVLLSASAFVPIFAVHQARGRAGLAGALACGWFAAAVLAHVGSAWEDGFDAVAGAVPGARAFAEARSAGFARAAAGGGADFQGALAALGAAAAVALSARLAAGAAAIFAASACTGLAGTAAARVAVGARHAGLDPVMSALLSLPPTTWSIGCGALLCAAGLAAPGPIRPLSAVSGRRRLLVLGTALVAAGALAEPWLTPRWAEHLAERGALDLTAR